MLKANLTKKKLLIGIYVLLGLLYVGVKLGYSWQAVSEPRSWSDTVLYEEIAAEPLWGATFLGAVRPPTVPLLYKILGSNLVYIASFQLFLSTLCWLLLACAVARTLRSPWLRPVGFVAILLFSLARNIHGWDGVMMAESVALSLMALLIAIWLWILEGMSWKKTGALLLIALLWVFTREVNAWLILFFAGITLFLALWQRAHRLHLVLITSAFIAFFVLNDVSSNTGQRWLFPFQNVLAQRILTNEDATDYFKRHGMPVDAALMQRAGGWASTDNWAFYKDIALGDYRTWLYAHGKTRYMLWLVASPRRVLVEPLEELPPMLTANVDRYFSEKYIPLLSPLAEEMLYPRVWSPLLWWVAALLIGVLLRASTLAQHPVWLVPLLLILLVYPHAFVVWHGDAMEINRHSLMLAVHFYLAILLLWLLGLDAGLKKIRNWRETRPLPDTVEPLSGDSTPDLR